MMGKSAQPDRTWITAALFGLVLYASAIAFRPVLPIDETRYLSVAWEMWLRHDWLAPLTVNFEAYHHKPPLLFWLINAMWSVFGVSRWSALIPLVLASIASVVLTGVLCGRLLPELRQRAQLVMLGSFAFVAYATLVLFDITMTVFVLGSLLCLHAYAGDRKPLPVLIMGLLLGLGVLTKGPVTYLYVLFPVLLAPYWVETPLRPRSWYLGSLAALLISLVPVSLWLIPVLQSTSGEFAYWLLWEQSAGRITGSFAASHDRPVWFYVLVLPVMLVPWVFFGEFWAGLGNSRNTVDRNGGLRFLACWLLPTVLAFSLIHGKQPHYLVPLLPGLAILVAHGMQRVSVTALTRTATAMLALSVGLYALAAGTVFGKYDLQPVADYLATHPDQPIAFVGGHYRGELTYLARLDHPVETIQPGQLDGWYDGHPDGLAIVRYSRRDDIGACNLLLSQPYRARQIGIAAAPSGVEPAARAGIRALPEK